MKEKIKKFWDKHGTKILLIGTVIATAGVTYNASKEGMKDAVKEVKMEVYICPSGRDGERIKLEERKENEEA